ncbi:hypothetical protein BGW39_009497, partial [Mortierella sp. 14UC]
MPCRILALPLTQCRIVEENTEPSSVKSLFLLAIKVAGPGSTPHHSIQPSPLLSSQPYTQLPPKARHEIHLLHLLISVAIASVASAIPLNAQGSGNVNVPNTAQANANTYFDRLPLHKRCGDCTHKDTAALNVIIKASADHYADIAH